MTHEDFTQALTRTYLQNPCQVLPRPLWQMLTELDGCETAIASDQQGVNRLEAWTADSLMLYWRRDNRQPSLLISRRLGYQQTAMIHQDFLDAPTVAGFQHFQSQYRLMHRQQVVDAPELPAGFRFAGVVNSTDEAQAMMAHIEQEKLSGMGDVQAWLDSPAFASDLWLWVVDEASDQPAGIAIAELDPQLREAAVRWVQVFPDYQGRGLGRALVQELLHRIGGRALFTTVTGIVEDRDNPGAFFRCCGFSGDDVWWYLSRT